MTFWVALALVLFHVVERRLGDRPARRARPSSSRADGLLAAGYSQRRRVQVGAETLIGLIVEVAEDCRPFGLVRVQGELWGALCREGAARGERVRVTGRDGLTLEVERAPD